MFDATVYSARRARLRSDLGGGLALLLGNDESPMNYPANTYHYRQDSTFLYFCGLSGPGLAAVIDADEGTDTLFGNDFDLDDIIWMGPQPTLADRARAVGVTRTAPAADLADVLRSAVKAGRTVHVLPPYRAENARRLESLIGLRPEFARDRASHRLIQAVVAQRSIKSAEEVAEIERAVAVTAEMHQAGLSMARPGVYEREIAGRVKGIAAAGGGGLSFPVICTVNGQTLHNHYHGNRLEEGRMLILDCGAETVMGYAGDITRSYPVGGRFNAAQRDIYEVVLRAQQAAIAAIRPGILFREVHLLAARTIVEGLSALGIMRGDPGAAVAAGAHALFFPHGLGHMMGLDVHDMEDLGENHVGYDGEVRRSDQFGLAYLRLARKMEPGFVLTVEPGIYFIPALQERWRNENRHAEFIDYDAAARWLGFGGVRLEDDILVTTDGYRVLGPPIPKTPDELEAAAG